MLYKKGCSGKEIGIVQNNLNMLGYDPKVIDCVFGTNTETAVKEFQGANGLVFDGIVGSQTMESLFKNDSCNSSSTSSNFDISDNGINFIADYEDFYSKSYRGLDYQNETMGYGHVITYGENFESLTEGEAKALLQKYLQSFVHVVNIMTIGLDLKKCQFDALVSFSYNCGVAALKDSSLLRDIKAGADNETIKDDFLMWSNCNHEKALGLYRRRYDEYEMYSTDDYTRTYRESFLPDFYNYISI